MSIKSSAYHEKRIEREHDEALSCSSLRTHLPKP